MKLSKKERKKNLADWVICNGKTHVSLNDVLPFPIRSGFFNKRTRVTIDQAVNDDVLRMNAYTYCENDPWVKLADRVVAEHRKKYHRWWNRIYFYWGDWVWPRSNYERW